jgi:hypothetical protein
MSLIFKALQRFGDHASTQRKAQGDMVPKKRPNSLSLRSILSSNATVLIAVVGIFAAGLLVSQSLHFFPKRIKAQTRLAEAASDEQAPSADAFPVAEPIVGEADDSGNSQQIEVNDPQKVTYRVHAPERPPSMVTDASVEEDRVGSITEEPAGADSGRIYQGAAVDLQVPVETYTAASKEHDRGKTPVLVEEGPKKIKTGAHHIPTLSMVSSGTLSAPRPVKSIHHQALQEDDGAAVSELDSQHRKISVRASRHLEISRLAHRIHSAIQADDAKLTSRLIGQLSKLKGPQNNFVLKLKAYALIRQNRFDDARKLLSHVLSRRAGDLEAGLNMAVVDIKTGRYQSARQRLLHLQGLYPEEANIAYYLRQLPRSP